MPLYSAKAGFLFYGTVVVELVFVPFIDVAVEIGAGWAMDGETEHYFMASALALTSSMVPQ